MLKKYTALVIMIDLLFFLPVTWAGNEDKNSWEGVRPGDRKKISDEELNSLGSTELIQLYSYVLYNSHKWHAGNFRKIKDEIVKRKEPDMDDLLIALFEKVLEEDIRRGYLDSFAGKRTGKRSETVLHLLGRRRTEKAVEFVSLQTASEKPVIRAKVASSLGLYTLSNLKNEKILQRVLPLLNDPNPHVVNRTLRVFVGINSKESPAVSPAFVRGLLKAERMVPDDIKVRNERNLNSLKKYFGYVISTHRRNLINARKRAGKEELAAIDESLKLIDAMLATRAKNKVNTHAEEGTIWSEGVTPGGQKKISEEVLGSLGSTELVQLYSHAVLDNSDVWYRDSLMKIEDEVLYRKDPDMDDLLTSLFKKVLKDDIRRGNLDSSDGKRAVKRSESVLHIISRRRTDKAVEFVLQQAANENPVIRAEVARSLGLDTLSNLKNENMLLRVLPLLNDPDPDVVHRTLKFFVGKKSKKSPAVSPVFARELLKAEKMIPYNVKAGGRKIALMRHFEYAIKTHRDNLINARKRAGKEELAAIGESLQLIDAAVNP